MYVNQPIREKKKKFRWWKIPLILIAVILAVAIIYVAYVMISYNRIDDNTELSPLGFLRVTDYASGLRPSTRNTDIPYSKDSFVATLDGFIISDNVESTYVDVVDTGFQYSDHNPVEMRFKLKA